jgi:hypothetical protein
MPILTAFAAMISPSAHISPSGKALSTPPGANTRLTPKGFLHFDPRPFVAFLPLPDKTEHVGPECVRGDSTTPLPLTLLIRRHSMMRRAGAGFRCPVSGFKLKS